MSVTTTSNPITQTVLHALADYELTHTENDSSSIQPPNPRSSAAETRPNPDSWPTDFNDVPPYRPINYALDREQRPWSRPGIETAFVFAMLNGCGLIAATARLWHNTGGQVNDKIFRYSIGGER